MSLSNKPKVIILLGVPGCGKGTQATRVSKELKLPHISTGDLFRENFKNETELGRNAKTYINQGKLVPDELVLDMLFDRVSRPDCEKGYILDGFPRTIPQADALDHYLKDKSKIIVVNLDCQDETVIKRISGRLTCQQCGAVFNQYFSPPKEDGKCDHCQESLVQRQDDHESVVKERLNVYHRQTKPLIDYYNQKALLVNINGEEQTDIVYQSIINLVI